MTEAFRGGCHCGALGFAFGTARPFAPRSCQCSFCRRHGARTVTDPAGSARLTLGAEARRYRFATKSSDYILCGRCGVYLGAVVDLDGEIFATLNLNAFDDLRLDLPAAPVCYDGETVAERRARRRIRWTPAIVEEA